MSTSIKDEVETALAEIENKYSTKSNVSKQKASTLIVKLLQEFESLGIANDGNDIFTNVVVNAFTLINIHRKTITKLQDCNMNLTKCNADNAQLQKKIDVCKKELRKKDCLIETSNRKLVLSRLEAEDFQKENLKLQQEVQNVKRGSECRENSREHKLKQLSVENRVLKDTIEKNVGNYVSRDVVTADVMRKYKINEEIYKDTIRKLEDNNRGLLEEILNLKEEVVLALFNENSVG